MDGWRVRACTEKLRSEHANSGIEFSIIIVVLLSLFLGTVDFSRVLYYDTAVQNAARAGLETAIDPCAASTSCLPGAAPTSDSTVMWSAYCAGYPTISLSPQEQSCPPVQQDTSSCTSVCTPCTRDVCIQPTGSRSSGDTVTVTVGYDFQPLSFLMAPFLHATSCYTGDDTSVNHHTLCASYTGQVSGS
jgi:hypothetical protein